MRNNDRFGAWLNCLPGFVAAALVVGFLYLATILMPALIEVAPWEEWLR